MPRGTPTIPIASVMVLAGLALCVAAALAVSSSGEPLPGVALGSSLVLVVERAMVLFAAWMAVVVVVARALRGELPVEVSGRGLRYAEADAVEHVLGDSLRVLAGMSSELDAVRESAIKLRAAGTTPDENADML